MARLSFEELKAQFKKNDQGTEGNQNNYLPFWNMEVGEQVTVRFLPDANEDNPTGFIVEKLMHVLEINGEKKSVPCLKMYGEDCPICKVSAAFYKKDDKANGKKYWRKKQYITQALIIDDPLPADKDTGETHVGKVRFLALGNKIYDSIKDAFESGDLDDSPDLFQGGTNFVIKKRQQGDYADYSRSSFVKRPSDLDDETIAHVKEAMVDLSTLLPKHPTLEKVEAMLQAALTGSEYTNGSDSGVKGGHDIPDDDAPVEKVSSVKQAAEKSSKSVEPKKAEPKPTPKVEESDGDGEDDPDVILARLRARRQAKAADSE